MSVIKSTRVYLCFRCHNFYTRNYCLILLHAKCCQQKYLTDQNVFKDYGSGQTHHSALPNTNIPKKAFFTPLTQAVPQSENAPDYGFLTALGLKSKEAGCLARDEIDQPYPVEHIKTRWINKLVHDNTEKDDLIEVQEIMHEDRDGVFARKTFRFGDFVLEWKGSLTQSGHLKKRKSLADGRWRHVYGVTNANDETYNLNICALDVDQCLRVFFTARRQIDIGEELTFSMVDLTRKFQVLRRKNRPIFE